MNLLEFWDSKRPYGNKYVEASIAYQLGWDYNRLLIASLLPEFVRKLHAKVKEELEKE